MSSSTIILKPKTTIISDEIMSISSTQPKSKLMVSSLWIFSSIFSAAKIDFSSNLTGISIGFNLQDVLLIMFTAWMLQKGLTTRNFVLILPWVIGTGYGLYYNHYKSFMRMAGLLKHVRHATSLPWIAIFFASVALVLRALLILRILQLSANLWYRKKLEKELYEPIR
ncbi:uncharacterized protein LOC130895391 [Diorhabda carinulata]|uniref:uncharacterized protein LOC130447659 n=1 Tax=Diorhabda sublineata TaxID=1163346 RepID=UPI0024E1014D|nr:uncharacterized protein LOC130447659 [Diorhabda sublineata]XP_057658623.1 uncharacterized protein LOC130895391 [Diorhabda carinulata]